MSIERERRWEQPQPTSSVEAIQCGEVSEGERQRIRHIKEQALRYGQSLSANNFEGQTGKPLTVEENLQLMEGKIERRVTELQGTANGDAYRALSPEEREKYNDLARMTPEDRRKWGEEWRQPEDLLDVPDVRTMNQDDLEVLKEKADANRAEYMMHSNFDPYTGEDMRYAKWKSSDPDGSMKRLMKLTTKITQGRKTIEEAIALQMEHPGLAPHQFGQTPEQYLHAVRKELDSQE